jgi:hypothetical protein
MLIAPTICFAVPVAFDNTDLLELEREQSNRSPEVGSLAALARTVGAHKTRYQRSEFETTAEAITSWRPQGNSSDVSDPTPIWQRNLDLSREAKAYVRNDKRKRLSLAGDSLFADRSDAQGRITWNDDETDQASKSSLFGDNASQGALFGDVAGESTGNPNTGSYVSINGLVINLGAVRLWNESIKVAMRDLFEVAGIGQQKESYMVTYTDDARYASEENDVSGSSVTGQRSRGSSNRQANTAQPARRAAYSGEAFAMSPELINALKNVGILAACTALLLLLLPNIFVRTSILVSATLLLVIII